MELGLSLGDASNSFGLLPKNREVDTTNGLGLCMALGIDSNGDKEQMEPDDYDDASEQEEAIKGHTEHADDQRFSLDPPVQLDLLPLAPVPRHTPSSQPGFPWSSDNGSSEGASSGNVGLTAVRGFDVNRLPPAVEEVSSPNSVASSFQMDFYIYNRGGNVRGKKSDPEASGNDVVEEEKASSRGSDEEENGLTRKKLRLSKEQSAYLEESFKEHNTLNPKQKLALAKQLNLRPRQVEVWFQNRRARTKLKQTEVDFECLKSCCETLTEENRRLHKELQELRALKTSNPFCMQLPATTLTMCPSCERVATATTSTSTLHTTNNSTTTDRTSKAVPFPPSRPRLYPFSNTPTCPHQSAGS